MPLTVILRYSDYEGKDTILEHQKLIEEVGYVWWGWWGKQVEQERINILRLNQLKEQISQLGSTEIGIADTPQEKYYSANCSDVEFRNDGSKIPSPSTTATPVYYNEGQFPIWYKLSSITEVTDDIFKEKFTRIPVGNPTLIFVITRGRNRVTYEPDPFNIMMSTYETRGSSILHLSDLHFGEFYGFPFQNEVHGFPRPTLQNRIADFIMDQETNIGIVVVSGDFICKGDGRFYPHATNFLNELLEKLELEPNHMILVPGNHDIPIENRENATREYNHELQYIHFLRAFYGDNQINKTERIHTYQTHENQWELTFVGLNSARLRTIDTEGYGFIGSDRYTPYLQLMLQHTAGDQLSVLARRNRLSFSVIHHHLVAAPLVCDPIPDIEKKRPISVTIDSGRIIKDFLEAGIYFVLHGHQHVPFIGSTSRCRLSNGNWIGLTQPMYLLGCGSTGATTQWLSNELRENVFSIYTPLADGLEIKIYKFNPDTGPQLYMRDKITY